MPCRHREVSACTRDRATAKGVAVKTEAEVRARVESAFQERAGAEESPHALALPATSTGRPWKAWRLVGVAAISVGVLVAGTVWVRSGTTDDVASGATTTTSPKSRSGSLGVFDRPERSEDALPSVVANLGSGAIAGSMRKVLDQYGWRVFVYRPKDQTTGDYCIIVLSAGNARGFGADA